MQENLELVLEGVNKEHRLKTEWKEVVGAVSLFTKMQRQRDKSIVNDVSCEVKDALERCSHVAYHLVANHLHCFQRKKI